MKENSVKLYKINVHKFVHKVMEILQLINVSIFVLMDSLHNKLKKYVSLYAHHQPLEIEQLINVLVQLNAVIIWWQILKIHNV